jgi:membrane-associated phospholipid phosphatase
MKTALLLSLILACSSVSYAGSSFSAAVSDNTRTTLALAMMLPALTGAGGGKAESARVFDAQLTTVAVTCLLKGVIHETRPDGSDEKSFPSGHTSMAFATAASLAETDKKHKWIYYGLAGLVGWSRVDQDKHYWTDVAAGAAIGYTCGKWSVNSDKGILLGRKFKF